MKKLLTLILTILLGGIIFSAAAFAVTNPVRSAVNAAGTRLYVPGRETISIKNISNPAAPTSVGAPLALGASIYDLVVNNGLLFASTVASNGSARIYVYNISGDPLTYVTRLTLPAGVQARGITIANSKLYVADNASGNVYVYTPGNFSDAATYGNPTIYTINGGNGLYGIAVSNTSVYVGNKASGMIYVYSITGGTVTSTLGAPSVTQLVFSEDNSYLFARVLDANGNDVRVLSTLTNRYIASVNLGGTTSINANNWYEGMSFSPADNSLYLVKYDSVSAKEKLYKYDISGAAATWAPVEITNWAPGVTDSISIVNTAANAYIWRTYSDNANFALTTTVALPAPNAPPAVVAGSLSQTTGKFPVVDIPAGGRTNQNSVTFKFNISDPNVGDTLTPQVSVDAGQTWISGNPVVYAGQIIEASVTVSDLQDNSYNWRARVIDNHAGTSPMISFVGNPDFIVDTTGPIAICGVDPVNNVNSIVPETKFELLFTEAIMAASINTSSIKVKYSDSASNLPITVSYDEASNKAIITPQTPLVLGKTIEIFVYGKNNNGKIITDLVGNALNTLGGNDYIPFSYTVKNSDTRPIIYKLYPNKTPQGTATSIKIEGINLDNLDSLAIVNGVDSTPLTITFVAKKGPLGSTINDPYQILTIIPKTIPALPIGQSYDIRATEGLIVSPNTPADDFTVIMAGSDHTATKPISDLTASSGENAKSTLSWTNPTAMDLREIVIRRSTKDGYPADHNSETSVYTNTTVEPGAAMTYVDRNLTNGTTYKYAIFTVDTSGNWSGEPPVEGKNAASATPVAPVVDNTAPSAINDLTAETSQNSGEILIHWTSVGDDGNVGEATGYIIKYSNAAIDTEAKFDAATTYVHPIAPMPTGARENYSIPDLQPGSTVWVAVKAVDEAGNKSPLGNSASAVVGGQAGGQGVPLNLIYSANRGNVFWVSVPYTTNYTKASDIIKDINTQLGKAVDSGDAMTSIGRWVGMGTKDTSPQNYESYDFFGAGLGWGGTDFNLSKGEAVYINISANVNFTLNGLNDPNFVFNNTNLAYNANRGNIFWVSLPYNGNYTDASSIVNNINTSLGLDASSGNVISSIGRWDGVGSADTPPQSYASYDYMGADLGWGGTNFNFNPGEGYFVSLSGPINGNWTPATR